jgi:hypothetical protein
LIFIVAAVLTPSTDPWNQTVFAAPMIELYLISIGIASLVAPRSQSPSSDRITSARLKFVFAAAVIDQVRSQRRSAGEFPRLISKTLVSWQIPRAR